MLPLLALVSASNKKIKAVSLCGHPDKIALQLIRTQVIWASIEMFGCFL
jgi:hypothetical protein